MPIQRVLSEGRVPVKIWASDIEEEAVKQLGNAARLPFVFKHVAAMPDAHAGKGSVVGTVMATKGAISPAVVGVDLGCGMIAVRLDLSPIEGHKILDNLPQLRHSIERSIPTGFERNNAIQSSVMAWEGWKQSVAVNLNEGLLKTAVCQLGTLGGGNHFIEICTDKSDYLWVMLHSGSRNVGKTLAEIHLDSAKDLMKRMFIDLPDPDLAYLVQGTAEFNKYIEDLEWAQSYAAANREEMLNRVLKDISFLLYKEKRTIPTSHMVNCHHNYVSREHHFNTNVLVTRKGAVSAREGELGIIPGSMGTKSYIVKGKGNPDSFCSCSHGAGRRMSRSKARATFTQDDLKKQTEGVECRKDEKIIDEIPGAYKDLDTVMQNQSDLVEVVAELKAVLCIKGS